MARDNLTYRQNTALRIMGHTLAGCRTTKQNATFAVGYVRRVLPAKAARSIAQHQCRAARGLWDGKSDTQPRRKQEAAERKQRYGKAWNVPGYAGAVADLRNSPEVKQVLADDKAFCDELARQAAADSAEQERRERKNAAARARRAAAKAGA